MEFNYNIETLFYLSKHFSKLSRQEKERLKTRFSETEILGQLKVSGSKFLYEFAKGPADLIGKLSSAEPSRTVKELGGRMAQVYHFQTSVGYSGILSFDEIPERFHDSIKLVKRGENMVYVWTSSEKIRTSSIVLIIEENTIITCFPGNYAPALPKPDMPALYKKQSQIFWSNHVFLDFMQ